MPNDNALGKALKKKLAKITISTDEDGDLTMEVEGQDGELAPEVTEGDKVLDADAQINAQKRGAVREDDRDGIPALEVEDDNVDDLEETGEGEVGPEEVAKSFVDEEDQMPRREPVGLGERAKKAMMAKLKAKKK